MNVKESSPFRTKSSPMESITHIPQIQKSNKQMPSKERGAFSVEIWAQSQTQPRPRNISTITRGSSDRSASSKHESNSSTSDLFRFKSQKLSPTT